MKNRNYLYLVVALLAVCLLFSTIYHVKSAEDDCKGQWTIFTYSDIVMLSSRNSAGNSTEYHRQRLAESMFRLYCHDKKSFVDLMKNINKDNLPMVSFKNPLLWKETKSISFDHRGSYLMIIDEKTKKVFDSLLIGDGNINPSYECYTNLVNAFNLQVN